MKPPLPHQAPDVSEAQLDRATSEARYWRLCALLAFGLAALLIVLNVMLRQREHGAAASLSRPSGTNSPAGGATPLKPWGRLVVEPVVLERPDRLFAGIDPYFEQQPAWWFAGTSPEKVRALFEEAALLPEQRAWLIDPKNWRQEAEGLAIDPPAQLVLALPAPARAQIYAFLAGLPGNPFKNDPFTVATSRVQDWLGAAGLSAPTRELLRTLTYQRNTLTCFSDPGLLGSRIPAAERRPLLKALSRIPAQRAFLLIEPGDNLAAVTNYWNPAGRVEAMLPLLEGLTRAEKTGRVDLTYLLPRFAAQHLYTYPDPLTDRQAATKDCFWTALNFFRYPPEQRFLDPATRLRYLEDRYEPVTGEFTLGDILVLHDQAGTAVHACVYVAGGLVFTKNGASEFIPWVLMSYPDMLAYYSMGGPPEIRVHRARKPASS